MGLCCVNVAELYAGLSPQEQARAERLMDSLDFFPVSREAAKQAGRFRFEYARRGVSITTADALIASAAIEEGAVLITANVRDFPMTALQRLEQP
jgi:predicted nucleic acid-binding protein